MVGGKRLRLKIFTEAKKYNVRLYGGKLRLVFTKDYLNKIKKLNIEDCTLDGIVNISDIKIDAKENVCKRLDKFLKMVGNPYLFRVGDMQVRVNFEEGVPSIENKLINYFKQGV